MINRSPRIEYCKVYKALPYYHDWIITMIWSRDEIIQGYYYFFSSPFYYYYKRTILNYLYATTNNQQQLKPQMFARTHAHRNCVADFNKKYMYKSSYF